MKAYAAPSPIRVAESRQDIVIMVVFERIDATLKLGNCLTSRTYAGMLGAPRVREGRTRILTVRNIDEIMSKASTYRNNPVRSIRLR